MNVPQICTRENIGWKNVQTSDEQVAITTTWLWSRCLCGGRKPNIYAEKAGGWGGWR